MEDLIELYLFKNKQCPLPSLGMLQVVDTNAVAFFTEGKIEAPVPTIKFFETAIPPDDFLEFISAQKNIGSAEASALLKRYCSMLQNMDAYNEAKLPNAGKFYVNGDGNLVFKTMDFPKAILPEVSVHRVIHPAASHSMVVGDKQTTNTEMAAYYSDSETVSKDKWWIWAVAIAIISAAIIFFYLNNNPHSTGFGNSKQIEVSADNKTYSTAE